MNANELAAVALPFQQHCPITVALQFLPQETSCESKNKKI